ncbi:hypothetical protein ACFQZS_09585 [Mucilaginibacter calamicampi]|uniref:Uncharacterized protein n=1 Tax=Mucilaginibacter calamicampi TaxID=1302352 RepID=A0ABW2YVL2_9SPHI
MENNKKRSDDVNQDQALHNPTNRSKSNQEQQSNSHKKNGSSQEDSGNKYLSNGYLDDRDRYDDTEL